MVHIVHTLKLRIDDLLGLVIARQEHAFPSSSIDRRREPPCDHPSSRPDAPQWRFSFGTSPAQDANAERGSKNKVKSGGAGKAFDVSPSAKNGGSCFSTPDHLAFARRVTNARTAKGVVC